MLHKFTYLCGRHRPCGKWTKFCAKIAYWYLAICFYTIFFHKLHLISVYRDVRKTKRFIEDRPKPKIALRLYLMERMCWTFLTNEKTENSRLRPVSVYSNNFGTLSWNIRYLEQQMWASQKYSPNEYTQRKSR